MYNQHVPEEFVPAEPNFLKKAVKAIKKASERGKLRWKGQPFRVMRRSQRYEIKRELGKGGFGAVFQAMDIKTKRMVALKKLHITSENIEEIEREIMFLSMMHSEFIARMLDSFRSSKDSVYIAMELCTGGELFDVAAKYNLTEPVIKQITFEVLSALQYAHSKEVAHMDVKLENIILSRPWNGMSTTFPSVKLVDWGLAKTFEEFQDCPCLITGTPYYVAPEVLKQNYDQKADLWSLGVVVYLMCTGNYPFISKDGLKHLFRKIIKNEVKYEEEEWMGFSDNALRFVMILLTKDALSRPETERALMHEWFREGVELAKVTSIVPRLARYAQYGKLRKHMLRYVMSGIDAEQTRQIAKHFFEMTKGKSMLSFANIKIAVLNYAAKKRDFDLIDSVSKIDLDGNSMMAVQEFIVAMLAPFYNTRMRLVDFFDASRLEYTFTREYVTRFFTGDAARAQKVFDEIDTNKNGKIDVREFIQWMLNDD